MFQNVVFSVSRCSLQCDKVQSSSPVFQSAASSVSKCSLQCFKAQSSVFQGEVSSVTKCSLHMEVELHLLAVHAVDDQPRRHVHQPLAVQLLRRERAHALHVGLARLPAALRIVRLHQRLHLGDHVQMDRLPGTDAAHAESALHTPKKRKPVSFQDQSRFSSVPKPLILITKAAFSQHQNRFPSALKSAG
eukprot:1176508-Prorocentrum_minimum.AAC.3